MAANRLDPDQAQHFVGPDLGPNCLQNYQLMTISTINSLPPRKFFMFLSSADFFQNQIFQKILSGIPS